MTIENESIPTIVLGNDKKSATRRQFNASHELGHIIMHDWNCNIEELSKEEFRELDNQANLFAASFLMPKESFVKDLKTIYVNKLDSYIALKQKWRVSISAMVIRAYNLGEITVNQYQYLMRQISQKGWKSGKPEPLDEVIKMEKPSVFRKSIDIFIANNVLTRTEILSELSELGLGLDREDIETLMNLPNNTLYEKIDCEISNIVKLKEAKVEYKETR